MGLHSAMRVRVGGCGGCVKLLSLNKSGWWCCFAWVVGEWCVGWLLGWVIKGTCFEGLGFCSHARVHTHTHIHACIHAYTHTHTHTHTRMHTNTHARTHMTQHNTCAHTYLPLGDTAAIIAVFAFPPKDVYIYDKDGRARRRPRLMTFA